MIVVTETRIKMKLDPIEIKASKVREIVKRRFPGAYIHTEYAAYSIHKYAWTGKFSFRIEGVLSTEKLRGLTDELQAYCEDPEGESA